MNIQMKILVIITTGGNLEEYIDSIITFRDFMSRNYSNCVIDYACISSSYNFSPLEGVLSLKYREVNPARQLSKVCDFITKYKEELVYDWFIKTRPEIHLNRVVDLSDLLFNSIHARAREYKGPKQILFGSSVGGSGFNRNHKKGEYNDIEESIVLDDQFYIFHRTVVELGAFLPFEPDDVPGWYIANNIVCKWEHEWFHSNCWKSRNIQMNVIGIDIVFERACGAYTSSGNLNC
jgi:hypothetical protein